MYAHALFPDRHRSCGVQLLPLTLGHALLLERLGNPFARPDIAGDTSITFDQVLVAAMVASRPWPAAARLVNSWRAAAWLRVRWMLRRRKALADTLTLMAWHQTMWAAPPSRLLHKYDGPRRGAEFLNLLAVSAATYLHKGSLEALDLQVTRLQWDLLVAAEQSGAVIIGEDPGPSLVEIAKAAMAKDQAKAPAPPKP